MNQEIKDLIHWIDTEITVIHIFLYIIMGILLGGYWWFLFGFLILFSTRYIFQTIRKMKDKKCYK